MITLQLIAAVQLLMSSVDVNIDLHALRTGSDGSMSTSGSAGLGFDPWRGSKFSFENFQPRG